MPFCLIAWTQINVLYSFWEFILLIIPSPVTGVTDGFTCLLMSFSLSWELDHSIRKTVWGGETGIQSKAEISEAGSSEVGDVRLLVPFELLNTRAEGLMIPVFPSASMGATVFSTSLWKPNPHHSVPTSFSCLWTTLEHIWKTCLRASGKNRTKQGERKQCWALWDCYWSHNTDVQL